MNNFEIFEKIITGDLRPHKYDNDGKALEEQIIKLGITDEDLSKYIKFLDKKGKSYRIRITDHETGETLIDEKRNDEFNELIDIDIPPEPDKKGEKYVELIEFEYARNLMTIDNFLRENKRNKIEEYAIKNLQLLRTVWQDLKLYKKLIIQDKGLDYEKSNDYVLIVLEVYLERTFAFMLDEFEPYLNNEYKINLIEEIFGEKQRKLKEIDAILSSNKLRKRTEADKRFDAIFEQLTKAKTIEEKIYNELEFWKNHKYEKIDGISEEELKFISKSMVENFKSELDKARITGWIRGQQIEFDKAERLFKYMIEILSEFDMGDGNRNIIKRSNDYSNEDAVETDTELQRDRIRKYLLEYQPDIKDNIDLNLNGLAFEIVAELFPEIKGTEKRKKKESIRQELMLFKSGKLDL